MSDLSLAVVPVNVGFSHLALSCFQRSSVDFSVDLKLAQRANVNFNFEDRESWISSFHT